jgi:hypothetical protein
MKIPEVSLLEWQNGSRKYKRAPYTLKVYGNPLKSLVGDTGVEPVTSTV